jgi:hypothetical protein
MALYANLYGPEVVEYPNGAHASNVPILVKNTNGSTAVLYTGADRAAQAANPVFTDSLGNLAFWADPGNYLLDAPGVNVDIPIAVMTNPAEPAGGGGGGGSFRHIQNTPALEWTANHNLGFPPAGLLVRETSGDFLTFEIVENTPFLTIVSFGNLTSGYLDCS